MRRLQANRAATRRGTGKLLALAGILVTATAARADERVALAAPPAWVHPQALPADPGFPAATLPAAALPASPPPASPLPIRVLLSDQQVRFHGPTTSLWQHTAMRVLTPEGLASLATFAIQWKPETDSLTLNRLLIHRAGRTIDVLASQPTFTLLRPGHGPGQSADGAVIDGMRTAALPLRDLAVGDVLEVAYTVDRVEPLLNGHHDIVLDLATGGAASASPVAALAIAAQWDRTLPLASRAQAMPAPLVETPGAAWLQASAVAPLAAPRDAPARYAQGRLVEFSDWRGWGDVAATFTPLFDAARRLPPDSPLHAEIARIAAATPDRAAQAGMALALAEDRVRYLYVGLAQGHLRPASADETWARGAGDCKGKVALLLALLDGLGIPAEAALVNSSAGDGLDRRLPAAGLFDHVIARVELGGRVWWLDPTREGETTLDAADAPDFHWALPLHAGANALEAIPVAPQRQPALIYTLTLDGSHGMTGPVPARAEITMAGELGRATHRMIAAVPSQRLDEALRGIWARQDSALAPGRVGARWNERARVLHLTMEGSTRIDLARGKGWALTGSSLVMPDEWQREPGPQSTAPFAIAYPAWSAYRVDITLPRAEAQTVHLDGRDIDQTLAGRQFYRKTERDGSRIRMVAWARPLAEEVSFAEAAAARPALHELARAPVVLWLEPEPRHLAALSAPSLPPMR